MKSIALKKKYLVKESVSPASLHESYLIIDPEDNSLLARVTEKATIGQKFAKLFFDKGFLPVNLEMTDHDGDKLLDISAPASVFSYTFTVKYADGRALCVLKQKFALFQPRIIIEDQHGQRLGKIDGGWKFRNFQIKDNNDNPVANIRHIFAGLAKELFTTADDYEVTMEADAEMSLITLASVICIDFMFHES